MRLKPGAALSITTIERPNGPPILKLAGDLDITTVPVLDAALGTGGAVTWVDCSDVGFIDSSGIRSLVLADRTRSIRLLRPSPAVRLVLETVGLRDLIADDDLVPRRG